MARRPNIDKTLDQSVDLATNQIARLHKFIEQVDRLLETNKQITPQEIKQYKVARRIAKKQITQLAGLTAMPDTTDYRAVISKVKRNVSKDIKVALAALDAASMQLPELGENVQVEN